MPTLAPSDGPSPPTVDASAARLWVVWAVWAAWALGWGGLILLTDPVVPVDNAEQLTWVRSLEWGYYKHPPWPTWFLWPWVQIAGLHGATAAAAGWCVGVVTVALLMDLVRRMALAGGGPAVPWMLAILVTVAGIGLVSNRLHYYNHNTWLWTWTVAGAWALWRALQSPAWRWWALLGLCLAGGLLTKLQGLTTLVATVLVVAQHRPGGRDRWIGLALACTVMAVLLIPHGLWWAHADHHPLRYVEQTVVASAPTWGSRLAGLGTWLGDAVLVRCGPAFLVVLLARWWLRCRVPPSVLKPLPPLAVRLLWVWAMTPLVFTVGSALLLGTLVRPHWATAMAPWWVVLACALALRGVPLSAPPAPGRRSPARRALIALGLATLGMHALWLAQFIAVEWRQRQNDLPARWGAPQVHRWAETVAVPARQALGGPIALVIAPEPIAHTLALSLPERPLALPDGRLEVSPWVPPQALERCGVLFVVYEPASSGGRVIPGAPDGLRWRVVPPTLVEPCPVAVLR